MARQDRHPNSWFETDGCTGVFDFDMRWACDIHDTDYHWGGPDFSSKLTADLTFYNNMMTGGWFWRHGLARVRYIGVRQFTYNSPPKRYLGVPKARHEMRSEAYNWLGPGRGSHAGGPAQGSLKHPELLPEQKHNA